MIATLIRHVRDRYDIETTFARLRYERDDAVNNLADTRAAWDEEVAELRDQAVADGKAIERLATERDQARTDLATVIEADRMPEVDWSRFGTSFAQLRTYDAVRDSEISATCRQVEGDQQNAFWRDWLAEQYGIDTSDPTQLFLLMAGVGLVCELAGRASWSCVHVGLAWRGSAMVLARLVPEQARPS